MGVQLRGTPAAGCALLTTPRFRLPVLPAPCAPVEQHTATPFVALYVSNDYPVRDLDRAWEAVRLAKRPRVHTFLATSPIHMEYKLRMSPDEACHPCRMSCCLQSAALSRFYRLVSRFSNRLCRYHQTLDLLLVDCSCDMCLEELQAQIVGAARVRHTACT